ncbi:MAG: amidase [Alphaproteobacteria bacterium]|nr:amidase [Alphaproteobacteria bacterium]
MDIADYVRHDGLGLAELVRKREVSPQELVRTARRAIAIANPTINAVVETYDDAPDGRPPRKGPFRGVPFLIKDVGQHFGGRRMENGSRLCRGFTVAADSNFARMVTATGVTLVGRSNTPEFSMALSAENLLYGATSNPWKLGASASGSSGGAAAAVAAGMVPIAHGSDMGGSIRGPAAWCGTIGLYPSRGRVSAGPLYAEGGNGMSQAFVMTRTMRDTAAMLDGLSIPQPGDPFVIRRPPRPFAAYTTIPAKPLRIGWSAAPLMDAPVDPEIATVVRRTAETLDGMGHHVEEAAPEIDLPLIDRACKDVWYFGFDQVLDDWGRRLGREVGPDTVERATLAFHAFAKGQSPARYFAALADCNTVRRTVGRFFTTHDVWLSPTCAQVAAPFGTYGMNISVPPEDFLVHEQRPCQFMIVNNVTGQPAISLPLGMHSNGLPIGVQLGARPGEEHLLVQLGTALEEAMPWRHRVPPLHVTNLG